MKSLLVIISGLFISWYLTDISSDSNLVSIVAPLGVFVFLISFFIRLVMEFQRRGISQTTSHNTGVGGFGDSGDGGDC